MVEIIGKRNRNVPVLLTLDVKAAIVALNRTREERNVIQENPYVFAVNDESSRTFSRGNDVIRQACMLVNLENRLSSLQLTFEKFVATVSQLVDMDQMSWDIWQPVLVMACTSIKDARKCARDGCSWQPPDGY